MIIPRLAFRNLLGAGLRTWLNVIVLSFAFVAIIWNQGLLKGMNEQMARSIIDAEYGGGQYWHAQYDPYDPFTLKDAHGLIIDSLQTLIDHQQATPILIAQGSIYPNGRIRAVIIKGIIPEQSILSLPSQFLSTRDEELPVLIGTRMANSTGLKVGDNLTLQWRDVNGMFDARDATIVQVMKTSVPTIDNGQIWIPLNRLQRMTNMPDEATIIVIGKNIKPKASLVGWTFRDLDFLMKDIHEMVQSKTVGSSIMYVLLLFLAMLAIFDTQVLSIFRRRREMGTLMAMGLTRGKLIQLFTMEGALNGILAAIIASAYGIPLLSYFARTGWTLPDVADSYGFAIGEKLFPVYTAGLVFGTTVVVLIVTTIVSYLPTRKISKLKPTDALKGK